MLFSKQIHETPVNDKSAVKSYIEYMKINVRIFGIAFFLLFTPLYSQSLNSSQVLPPEHWIYDYLKILGMENKTVCFNENSMMTVSEIRFYFEQIDEDALSESGKKLYEEAENFLYENDSLIDLTPFRFDIGMKLNGEGYYKSSDEIPWNFRYNYKDNFATFPIKAAFSDYVTLETDPFVGKAHYGSYRNENYTNFPYREGDFEFLFPRFSYGSVAGAFNGWGANIHIGKQGFQIGDTKIGSVIYNNTFETDAYINMNLFSKYFKYSMDITQISNEKWFYLHQFTVRFHKTFKFSALEGSMVNAPFEIRYLNPLMIMHQFSAWTEYDKNGYPDENHFCAYLAGLFDWQPIENLRIYGLYAQNELQLPMERNKEGSLYPDSLGGQLGFEVNVPFASGYWRGFAEAIYTSPFLYIKQNPESSLYRERGDNLIKDTIYSWVGSPFGPDSFGVKAGAAYELPEKWSASLGYFFLAKGENGFDIFSSEKNQKGLYTYYPIVKYKEADDKDAIYDEAYSEARNMWLSGIPMYVNQISLEGEYYLNSKFSTSARTIYSFIFNAGHEKGRFVHGVEFAISLSYTLL